MTSTYNGSYEHFNSTSALTKYIDNTSVSFFEKMPATSLIFNSTSAACVKMTLAVLFVYRYIQSWYEQHQ